MTIKCFIVGGAVRDILMGRQPKDVDFVLTGMTGEDVKTLISHGFEQVGADFPVFLNPMTGEEFALARTERKVGKGYAGFEVFTSPELTIEDDLRRRDLTINSMAFEIPFDINNPISERRVTPSSFEWFHNDQRQVKFGSLIDPFSGQSDLNKNILRHTSEAFVEDPVRVLRVARFAARFPDFTIANETKQLMITMAKNGELNHLVPERVFKEVEKAASEKNFVRFFEELPDECQIAIFQANVLEIANTPMFFKTTSKDVDRLTTTDQKIAFMFMFVPGFEEAMRAPAHLINVVKAMNMPHISTCSGIKREIEDTVVAIRKCGFLNSSNDVKFNDVMSIVQIVNPAGCEFVKKIVTEARSVDIAAHLNTCGKKPSFDVVTDIIVNNIFDKV